jgi:FG-GAP repeat
VRSTSSTGSPSGVDPANELLWTQDVPGVEGVAKPRDTFGAALAERDLNGDGIKDLAIGAPGEDVGTIRGAGSVNVLYGSSGGLAVGANKLFNQDTDGVADTAQSRDLFGSALASGCPTCHRGEACQR